MKIYPKIMHGTSVESKSLPELSPEEHALCKAAFRQFDSDGVCVCASRSHGRSDILNKLHVSGSGAISVKELKSAMIAMGQNPSDDEVFHLVALVCPGTLEGVESAISTGP